MFDNQQMFKNSELGSFVPSAQPVPLKAFGAYAEARDGADLDR